MTANHNAADYMPKVPNATLTDDWFQIIMRHANNYRMCDVTGTPILLSDLDTILLDIGSSEESNRIVTAILSYMTSIHQSVPVWRTTNKQDMVVFTTSIGSGEGQYLWPVGNRDMSVTMCRRYDDEWEIGYASTAMTADEFADFTRLIVIANNYINTLIGDTD